jgi:hypothetical protein
VSVNIPSWLMIPGKRSWSSVGQMQHPEGTSQELIP